MGAPSGEHQSATRFGVSANSSGENRSRVAIRVNCAGEREDFAGACLGLDVNSNLAGDDNSLASEVGGAEDIVLVRADCGETSSDANIK